MWIRSAFWVGKARPGMEAAFADGINTVIIPGLRDLPGVIDAEALWPRRLEDSSPGIACQIIVRFASAEAIDAMLASPERAAIRAKVQAVLAAFEGAFSHIDFEIGEPGAP